MKKRTLLSLTIGLSCIGLLSGSLFAAVPAQKESKVAKADDGYSAVETSVTKVKFVWNWLVLEFDNFDGGSEQVSYASSSIPKQLNYLNNIYFNGDPSLKAYDTSTTVLGYGMENVANRFWTAPSAAIKENSYANLKSITIPAGTEFPSITTSTGGEKIKYVTSEDVTFYALSGLTGNFELTREDKVHFVETSVTDFSATMPNRLWPAFKLSVNDYPVNPSGQGATLDSGTKNTAMYSYLNTLTSIQHTSYDRVTYPLGAKASNGTAFLNFASTYGGMISYAVSSDWGNSTSSYQVMYIPAGTQFPSYQFYQNATNPSADKTIYYTTEDVIFYEGHSNNGGAYTRVVPTFVENKIVSIDGLNSPFANSAGDMFTNFSFNLATVNQARGTAGTGYDAKWSLTQAMSYVELYDDENNLISLNNASNVCEYSYGAMFADFNKGSNDYLVQIKTGLMQNAKKVVFKTNALLPSSGYLAGKNSEWYKFSEDQTFIYSNGFYGCYNTVRDFVNDYMHPEVATNDPGTGKCISEGWYASAKTAFNSLRWADKILFIFYSDFTNMWLRLNQWAVANGDTFNGDVFQRGNNVALNGSPSSFAIEGIVIASLLTIAAASIFAKKKKEN